MVIWRTQKLIDKYNNGGLSDAEKFASFLTVTVLSGLQSMIWEVQLTGQPSAIAQSLFFAIITWVIAITYVYFRNKKGDPSHFVEKFFLVLLPATVKFIVIFDPIYFILYTLVMNPTVTPKVPLAFQWTLYLIGWVLFYGYIGKKIRLMNAKSAANQPAL